MPGRSETKSGNKRLSKAELEEIEERLRLRVPLVYHIIRAEGHEELARPVSSLWWPGVAAGLSNSMSVVVEGLLLQKLPDTAWRLLVVNFGYCTGFLIVVLGRLQLFTEKYDNSGPSSSVAAVLPQLCARCSPLGYRICRKPGGHSYLCLRGEIFWDFHG